MSLENSIRKFSLKEILIFLLILISGFFYITFTWQDTHNQENEKILQIAKSVGTSLPLEQINTFKGNQEDLTNPGYLSLKNTLRKVIQVNEHARFAYLYLERDGKLFFIADSEPENSPDYSPPGQEFTEADSIDKIPFTSGEAQVTKPITDRWGTWISAEVPIKDTVTGHTIAVFGMDYNVKSWNTRIFFEILESILLVVFILFLLIVLQRSNRKNILLKKEISHREKVEQELIESESYFRLLFELNPQPMIVYDSETLKIKSVNNSSIATYGYSEEEFLLMAINDLKAQKEHHLQKNHNGGNNSNHHSKICNHQTKSGRVIQVEIHSHDMDFRHKNDRLVMMIDVTEKLKAVRNLRENELTLRNLIGNLPGIVYRCMPDEHYTMEFMSEACFRITGYHSDDFIGNKAISYDKIIPDEYRQPIWEKWQNAISEKTIFEEEYPILTASGETKWVWERGSCIFDEDGEPQFLEGYIEDITAKKKNDAELIKAKEKAEESDRLKTAFLANISHEIRTPMNGIMGFAELLKEPDLSTEDQQEFISIIESNLHRMLDLISDLIDVSRIEAGETNLRIRTTNLNKMFQELDFQFLPQVNLKNIRMNYHCDLPDEESDIETDGTKLNQVLTNLIKNAVKFTTEGSITFGYKRNDSGIEFYVTDTGSGIHPEQKGKIFERFRQADQGLTRKFEGVGLGLTISKAYVEMLGGTLLVNSELGKGSTFFFDLPFQAPNSSL